MRTLAFALLLASAAAPSIAAPKDDDRKADRRPERSERAPRAEREDRSKSERPVQVRRESRAEERPNPSPSLRRPSLDRPEPGADAPREQRPVIERIRERAGNGRGTVETPAEPRLSGDSVRDWRARERHREDSPSTIEERNLRRVPADKLADERLVQPKRPLPRVLDPDRRERRISRTPLPGTEPPAPETARSDVAQPRHRWRDDWRRDRRYDWRDHRRRHRSLFHFSVYLDPFGWGYHRYGAGWRLWPSYYSSRYWLNDPWTYRLPPAYGPYRWIRYYDDALLVNIYSGQVVDVIHDFFW